MILTEICFTCHISSGSPVAPGPCLLCVQLQYEVQDAVCLLAPIPCVCGTSCNQFLDLYVTVRCLFYNSVTVWQCYAKNV